MVRALHFCFFCVQIEIQENGNVPTVAWIIVDVCDVQHKSSKHTCKTTEMGFESSVWSIWNSQTICFCFCCWMIGFSVAFEVTHWSNVNSWKSLEISKPLPDSPGLSALCKENTLRHFTALSDNAQTVLRVVSEKCSPLFSLVRWIFQKRKQSMETEDKQLAIFLGSSHSDGLFIINTTLPLAVSTEKSCRQAFFPVRFAQGSIASHRVSWIRGIVSVSELELLWWGRTLAVVLLVSDTCLRNTSFARRRWRCVIPRIIIMRTSILAR